MYYDVDLMIFDITVLINYIYTIIIIYDTPNNVLKVHMHWNSTVALALNSSTLTTYAIACTWTSGKPTSLWPNIHIYMRLDSTMAGVLDNALQNSEIKNAPLLRMLMIEVECCVTGKRHHQPTSSDAMLRQQRWNP